MATHRIGVSRTWTRALTARRLRLDLGVETPVFPITEDQGARLTQIREWIPEHKTNVDTHEAKAVAFLGSEARSRRKTRS